MHRRFKDYGLISVTAFSFVVAYALIYTNQKQFDDELQAYFDTQQGLYDIRLVDRSEAYLLDSLQRFELGIPADNSILEKLDLAYAYLNIGEYLQADSCVNESLARLDNLSALMASGESDGQRIMSQALPVLKCQHQVATLNLLEKRDVTAELLVQSDQHRINVNIALIGSYLFGLLLWGMHEFSRRRLLATLKDKLDWQNRAMVDALTGTLNRGALDEYLESRLSSAHGKTLSLLMYDIDHFKPYNDRFGHVQGDDVLRRVSQAVQSVLRDDDHQFRYGGEEFIVTTDVTSHSQMREMGERMLEAVRELNIPHPDTPSGAISISVGLYTVDSVSLSPDQLLCEVDKRLYQAKSQGRNQLYI